MNRTAAWLAVMTLALFSFGCGGGSGSGGSTGNTTPQSITSTNAAKVVAEVEGAGEVAGAVTTLSAAKGEAGGGAGMEVLPADVAMPVGEALMLLEGAGGYERAFALSYGPVMVPGACSGSAMVSGDWSVVMGTYTGTVAFSNFDNCSVVMGGTINVARTGTQMNHTSTATLSGVTVRDKATNELFTADGTIGLTKSGNTTTAATTLTITGSQNTFRLTNMVLAIDTTNLASLTPSVSYTINGGVALNGKSMTLSTSQSTPIYYANLTSQTHPSSGVLVIDGNGKLRITYLTPQTVRFEVDAAEDGTYEFTSETNYPGGITWSQLATLAGSQTL